MSWQGLHRGQGSRLKLAAFAAVCTAQDFDFAALHAPEMGLERDPYLLAGLAVEHYLQSLE